MRVKFVGFGGFQEYPVYEDEKGKFYFDANDGKFTAYGLDLYTGARKTDWDEFVGELGYRVKEPIECDKPFTRHPREFDYMMLDRMRQDCSYYLDCGGENQLWGGSIEVIISEMKRLYNSFDEVDKPHWIDMSMIESYEREMLKRREVR